MYFSEQPIRKQKLIKKLAAKIEVPSIFNDKDAQLKISQPCLSHGQFFSVNSNKQHFWPIEVAHLYSSLYAHIIYLYYLFFVPIQ